jgi:hypothetical protein
MESYITHAKIRHVHIILFGKPEGYGPHAKGSMLLKPDTKLQGERVQIGLI